MITGNRPKLPEVLLSFRHSILDAYGHYQNYQYEQKGINADFPSLEMLQ
jgi:hypothetical protein